MSKNRKVISIANEIYLDTALSYPSKVAVNEMQPPFFTLAPLSQLRKNLNECQSPLYCL